MTLPRTVRLVSRLLAACAVLSALDALAGVLAVHHLDTHRQAYLDAASRASLDAGTVVPDVHEILVRAMAVQVVAVVLVAVHGILVTAAFAGLVAVSFLLMRESANDFYSARRPR